jgi:Uma2 family endonuclease
MPMALQTPPYTTDMLETFPDDGNRYELVDGVLLVTPGPAFEHESVLGRLNLRLCAYLASGERALVLPRGTVQLPPWTHLEPDLLVVPPGHPRATAWREIRDWWLVVEVFSPSSIDHDRDLKRDAYLQLGVPEVWLIDPATEVVYVSRAGAPLDVPHRRRLVWHPAGMDAPLEIDVRSLFPD